MLKQKVQTWADVAKWLKTLSPEKLAAPVLATAGADDYGNTEYIFAVELVEIAEEHSQVSGAYQGPVLIVQELEGAPNAAEEREASGYAQWVREQAGGE